MAQIHEENESILSLELINGRRSNTLNQLSVQNDIILELDRALNPWPTDGIH